MHPKYAVVMLALFTIGCTEGESTAGFEPQSAAGIAQPHFNYVWPEGRYPTEEEYEAACLDGSYVNITQLPVGTFSSTHFTATAEVEFNCVNVAHAELTVQVKNNQGALLNNGVDQDGWDVYRPVTATVPLSASAGTLNRSCGLTGKSALDMLAELWLVRLDLGDFKPFRLYNITSHEDGDDVALPECPPPPDDGGGDSECGDDPYCEDEPPCEGEEDDCGGEEGTQCRWDEMGLWVWIGGEWVLVETWWEYDCDGEGGGPPGGGGQDSVDPPVTAAGAQVSSVQVVLVPDRDFRYGEAASAVRRDVGSAVIFLRESTATADVLTSTCRGLSAWNRRAEGSGHRASGLVKLTGSRGMPFVPGATAVLSELRSAPLAHHADVGSHRTVALTGHHLAEIGCR